MTSVLWPCGHPRTPENTQRVGIGNGVRCKACRREISRNSLAKRTGRPFEPRP